MNADGSGEGFTDTTPVAQVGGNIGTTLGELLSAFQEAASIWGARLQNDVAILIQTSFDPLRWAGVTLPSPSQQSDRLPAGSPVAGRAI